MRLRLPSRISVRLLLFNVLLVLLPVTGFLYLDVFEDQLLADQERAMVQQGRLLAAALSGQGTIHGDSAVLLLRRLEQRTESRLRVFGPDGQLLADSSRLGPRRQTTEAAGAASYPVSGRRSPGQSPLPGRCRALPVLSKLSREPRNRPGMPRSSEPYPSATSP